MNFEELIDKLASFTACRETTPNRQTTEILSFCRSICNGEPRYVDVRPETSAVFGRCHNNVKAKVTKNGGRIVYGWVIWEHLHWLTGEFHSCWEAPGGELIDITPKPDRETSILFLPDPVQTFQGVALPNRTFAKTEIGRKFLRMIPSSMNSLERLSPKQRAENRKKERRKRKRR